MMGINRSILAKAHWGVALGGLLLSSAAWAQARIESVTGGSSQAPRSFVLSCQSHWQRIPQALWFSLRRVLLWTSRE